MSVIKTASDPHVQAAIQATLKSTPALAPGAVTIAADWVGLINTSLSVVLMALSISFLLWRWRVAYLKEENEK